MLFAVIYYLSTFSALQDLVIVIIGAVLLHLYSTLWHSKRLFKSLWDGFENEADKCGKTRTVYAPIVVSILIPILIFYIVMTYIPTASLSKTLLFVLSFALVSALLSFHCFLNTGKKYAFFLNHYIQVFTSVVLITIVLHFIV